MKYALISVSDKRNILELAAKLSGYEIISTGGTAEALRKGGFAVTEVEDITGFPECMDGRVKTLHPRVHGGLLAVRGNPKHQQTMQEHNIPAIDVLVVNLYPFRETKTLENIDIGGVALLRAGAKNYEYVTVLCDPDDYADFDKLDRRKLAAKAFRYTAAYDAHIARYFSEETDEKFPETLTISFTKHSDMRYGENPQQAAAFYAEDFGEVLHGKALSFNNIADVHAAVSLVREFSDKPACVAVKHATPCGAALADSPSEAYRAVYDCDPISIFGGIVAYNREVDEAAALLMKETFLEVIAAPSFSAEALKILQKKRDLRLVVLPKDGKAEYEMKSVGTGLLIQETDNGSIEAEERRTVTKKAPSAQEMSDMVFGMKVVKHVKSNAIVVVKDGRLLGQGGGEVSRIWAAEAALSRAGDAAKGAVAASDAMIPFPDVAEACAKAGISAIIQPGGSKNDPLVTESCDALGMAMVISGTRHFKH